MNPSVYTVKATYTGQKGPMVHLAIVNGVLTLLTLGIYRFWAKTRLRKFIWSSVDIGGDGLEYTGTGLEKFLGFLVAAVVLAVYPGLIQIMLFYFGLHFVAAPKTESEMVVQVAVFYTSLFAVLPFTRPDRRGLAGAEGDLQADGRDTKTGETFAPPVLPGCMSLPVLPQA